MSSTTTYSIGFESILDAALESYAKQTGVDLTKHPSADQLQNCHSSEDITQLLFEREAAFKDYRDDYRKVIDCLRPVVQVIHAFSGTLGEMPLQPTKAIFVGINVLISAAIGVSASYDALVDLFECIANFLRRLHIYTEMIPISPAMSDMTLKIMVEILSVLALATKQINQGRFKKFTKKLLGESDIEAILQRLDRLTQEEARTTVAHTLEIVHGLFNSMKVVMDDGKASTDGIRQALVTIQETANRINKLERNQFQKDVRSWLSPPDPSTNHNIARRHHLDGTASWFTQSSTFKQWKTTGSLLWIHGKPGSGKSTLCSSIIQEIESLRNTGLALMTYFYCDFRDPKKQEVTGLLASLIAQLSAKSDACYDILSNLYSECDAGSRQPGDDALQDCLENMLKVEGQPTVYVIIDALDECPNGFGVVPPRERVLDLVENLVNLHLTNVRICATSRPEADIQAVLAPLTSHSVSLHDQDGQNRDIADYVRSIVCSDRKMRKWREDDRDMVIDVLSQKADGMFRWVVCQLEILRRSLPSTIRRILDDLPITLDETYDRILLDIVQERQEYARRLFQSLAVSIRPLSVEELAEILAIEFDTGAFPKYNANWRPENPEEEVLSVCSSLITIVYAGGLRVVQFSHFSVQEYLSSQRLASLGKQLSQYHILPHSAHMILAQASLCILLALDDQVNKDSMKNFPLAIYAARYWIDHAQFDNVSLSVKDAMECLFDPSKPYFMTWVWVYDIDHSFREVMFTAHPTPTKAVPLYYATLCGFRSLVEHLIATCPQDVNARGGNYSTPLHAAIAKGNVDITTLLLEHGADASSWNYSMSTPLHEAAQRAHLDIVKLLLECHADPDARDDVGWTPLARASFEGDLDVARVLLEHGASVDRRDKHGRTPLKSASHSGHLEIVRLLLQNGAAVDSRNNYGWTSLLSASRHGHQDLVPLLLQYGADVDARNKDDGFPLLLASQYAHLDIVRLLLQSGAAVDSHTNDSTTPLKLASRHGHSDVVRLLLQNGATVDFCDHDGWTALNSASQQGFLDVVCLLLESGAEVDRRSNDGWTPLMSASQGGYLDVACLLLKSGAAVESCTNDGWTLLDIASQNGHPVVVRLLLESGATVESRSKNGWTPLMSASRGGNSEAVHLLLESGAAVDSHYKDSWSSSSDTNLHGQIFCTPLHLASAYGHIVVAELLIHRGADVDKPDQRHETALGVASGHGQLKIAQLLLESGSNVNSQDGELSTPLHKAAQRGHLEIVTLLVNSGADANVRNNDDKTPFDLALDNRRVDVARFLMGYTANVDLQDRINSTSLDVLSQDALPNVTRSASRRGERTSIPDEGRSLHTAAVEGNLDVVRSLLDDGADVNERNASHATALLLASTAGLFTVTKLLIEYGADVNSQDGIGWTPLHVASCNGHLNLVYLLLDHGADVDAKRQDHSTALHLALSNDYHDVVKALLERGADIHAQNDHGRTPSQIASRRGAREIVRLLSEYEARGTEGIVEKTGPSYRFNIPS